MSYPVMSNFPIAMAKGLKKTPNFSSVVQRTAAGMGNSGVALKPYPTWDFEFDMDWVLGNEALANSVVGSFMGIYMQCQGQASLFLFRDPQDNAVSAMQFGTGNGTATAFQLCRTIGNGGATDILQNWNGSPTIYVNGVLTTPSSIDSTGIVTFSSAPANGVALTVTGSFYFLCRFSADTLSSVRSFSTNCGTDLWNVQSVKFGSEFVAPQTAGVLINP